MSSSENGAKTNAPPKPDLSKYPDIPDDALSSYNSVFDLYQVFRTAKLPHPITGVMRWTKEQIGSIKDGKFTISPTYKLKLQNHELQEQVQELTEKLKAREADQEGETAKSSAEVRESTNTFEIKAAPDEMISSEKSQLTGQSQQAAQRITEIAQQAKLDQRNQKRIEIPMTIILLAAVMTALGGETDCEQISDAINKSLKQYFASHLPDLLIEKISADTIRQALMLIKPEVFDDFYMALIKPLIRYDRQRIIAADGQAVRASGKKEKDKPDLHGAYMLMNFYDVTNRVCLYHRCIEKKDNEITAGPEGIRKLNIEGAVVTADAMSCQVNFVEAVLRGGGQYCLAVKNNQEATMSELRYQFNAMPEDRQQILQTDAEIGHGRIETYKVAMLPGKILSHTLRNKWLGLEGGCVVHVQRSSTEKLTGKLTEDERFYISSLSAQDTDVGRMAEIVRAHWGIENRLHWMLDMRFGQDRMQAKIPYYISNRSALNKLALSMLEHYRSWLVDSGREKSELSIQKLISRCAKSPETAMECLACGLGFTSSLAA